jgi:hypothetical protein
MRFLSFHEMGVRCFLYVQELLNYMIETIKNLTDTK